MNKNNSRKPSKILISVFIATLLYSGYKQFEMKNNIHSFSGAVSYLKGEDRNSFWREISKTDRCASIDSIDPGTSYTDIISSTYHCIKDNNYQVAAENYLLSFPYSMYDKSRVEDVNQHVAAEYISAKLGEEFESIKGSIPIEFTRLNDAVEDIIANNKDFCQSLNNLDTPTYTPNYMIYFNKTKHDLESYKNIPLSDLKSLWKKAIDQVTACN